MGGIFMQATKKAVLTKMENGHIAAPQGFSAAGIHTKVKRKRNDLGVIACSVPASAAAVFTLNEIQAAPLTVTKESLAEAGKLQAVVVNSGNANACSGKKGLEDAYLMRDALAASLSIPKAYAAVASTGVIGEEMPMDKILPGIQMLHPKTDDESAAAFGEAILTTDTIPKSTCYSAMIGGKKVTMAGAAKGSGMIAPNMATMLAFLTTDANISTAHLQAALREATDQTFNRITVDGDTSTNDMVLVMASGLAENEALSPAHKDWDIFMQLLQQSCEDLAKLIARDGEGATKLIEIAVHGALNDQQADNIAKTVVGSPLVKTMVFGADPNWGRLMMAIGKSCAKIDPNNIDIQIGPYSLLKGSQPISFSEKALQAYLEADMIQMTIHVHVGNGKGKAWGCDLTYDYVRINASYRT